MIVTGIQVTSVGSRVRLKILGLPGDTGPELYLTQDLAHCVEEALHQFNSTGRDQDIDLTFVSNLEL